MKFTSDKIEFTPAMRSFVEEIFENKLNNLILDSDFVEVKLNKLNNDDVKIDLCIGKFRVQDTSDDFYASFVKAANKMKALIIKNNKKELALNRKKQQLNIFESTVESIEELKLISKEKLFKLLPITIENAIDELEYTDYPFYVFKDINASNEISIIYKRHNDEYGLIKCI